MDLPAKSPAGGPVTAVFAADGSAVRDFSPEVSVIGGAGGVRSLNLRNTAATRRIRACLTVVCDTHPAPRLPNTTTAQGQTP